MLDQFIQGLEFYAIFTLLGVIGFAFSSRVFGITSVKAYLVSKPLGLLIFGFVIWLLSSFKILKFNNHLAVGIIFILAVIFSAGAIYIFYKEEQKKNKKHLKKFLLKILALELISIFLYLLYLYIRGFNAQLESTEKPMDVMLLASAGKTDYFPFMDPWQGLKTVNYYYYGFFLYSIICNLSGSAYAMGYNFALGIIFASSFVLTLGIVYSVCRSKLAALFGAALVNFSGNLHYAECYFSHSASEIGSQCFYPRATRIYDTSYTINEIPSYSYLLGDLHPHFMSLPFFFINLYFLWWVYKLKTITPITVFVIAISLATTALVNTWDFMTLGAIYAVIFLHKIYLKYKVKEKTKKIKDFLLSEKKLIFKSFIFAASPFIFFLPFFFTFKSPVTGIGFAPTFAKANGILDKAQYPSSLWFLLLFWGVYFFTILIGLLLLRKFKLFKRLGYPAILFIVAVGLILFTELFFFKDLFHVTNPPYFRANTVFKFTYHTWILMGMVFAIVICELIRATKFIKPVAYESAALFAISTIIVFYSIAVFLYPIVGTGQAYSPIVPLPFSDKTLKTVPFEIVKTSSLKSHEKFEERFTLDGSQYVKDKNINDYNTIQWLNEHQKDRVIILEAVGDSYTYFGRMSVFTGMANPVNWKAHEWTWRFKYPDGIKSWRQMIGKYHNTGWDEVNFVADEVKKIYETTDILVAQNLLKKYKVQYVYIGELERTTYGDIQEEKFFSLGEVVFKSGDSILIRIY